MYSNIRFTACSVLRSINIDILIDLSGFTEGNRFEALARRCIKFKSVGLDIIIV